MAIKRKFEIEFDDSAPTNAKQLKLIPFPNFEPDCDSFMSDVEYTIPPHHSRFPSNASSDSSNSDISSPVYPAFDLYPLPFFNAQGTVDPNAHNYAYYAAQSTPSPPIGLLQPSSSFSHHGTGCSQIPKLRVACSSSPTGQRTMWSHCEQCGAISMVDND